MSTRTAWVVLAVLALVVASPLALTPLGILDSERFPTIEVQEVIVGLHIFHDDAVGGFLIYKEWPDRLVYIDDRAELYGVERLLEYNGARQGRYKEVFARYGFDAALTRTDWPLTSILASDGWLIAVETEVFVVFVEP